MSNSYLKRLIKQEKLDNQTVVNLRNGMRDLRDKMFIYRPKLEPELIQDLDLSKFIGKYNDGTDQARLKNKELIQQIRDVFDWDKIKDKSWDNNDKTVSLRFWSNRLDYIDSLIDRIDEKKLSLHEIDDLKYVAGMVKNNWYLNHKVMEKSSDDVRVDFFNHLDSLDNKLTFKYLYANQKIESKIDQLYSQVPKSVREFRSKLSRAQVIGDVRIKKTADIINYIGTALDSDSHFIAINGQVTQLSSLSERFIAVRELAGKLNHKKISYDQLLTLNHNLELVQSDKLFPVDNSGNGNYDFCGFYFRHTCSCCIWNRNTSFNVCNYSCCRAFNFYLFISWKQSRRKTIQTNRKNCEDRALPRVFYFGCSGNFIIHLRKTSYSIFCSKRT